MEEMTWPEIGAALQAGFGTVLILAGAVEQHGPHLPLGTDTMLGYERGVRLAEALGNALVAPVIRPGISEHHMAFPGSFTISPETFKGLLREYCLSMARHNFQNIVLVPTHGGNYSAMEELLPELREALPRQKIILMSRSDSTAAHQVMQEELGVDPQKAGVHAGLVETAMVLVHRPDLVQMDLAPEGWVGTFGPEQYKILEGEGIQALSSNGVLGDARGATSEIGETYVARWTQIYADLISARLREPV